ATSPNGSAAVPKLLQRAAVYHDFRKKAGATWRLLRQLRERLRLPFLETEMLADDFRSSLDAEDAKVVELPSVRPGDIAESYLAFARSTDPDILSTERWLPCPPKLPRPFGNHADEFRASDFPDADEPWREEAAELVRLHHSFQANHLVAACARWGPQ